jgi:hypothetical protein
MGPSRASESDGVFGGQPVNQILRQYDGLGNLTAEYEEHRGWVTASTPKVQYVYDTSTSNNYSRLKEIIYPDGRGLDYIYNYGLDDSISREKSKGSLSFFRKIKGVTFLFHKGWRCFCGDASRRGWPAKATSRLMVVKATT